MKSSTHEKNLTHNVEGGHCQLRHRSKTWNHDAPRYARLSVINKALQKVHEPCKIYYRFSAKPKKKKGGAHRPFLRTRDIMSVFSKISSLPGNLKTLMVRCIIRPNIAISKITLDIKVADAPVAYKVNDRARLRKRVHTPGKVRVVAKFRRFEQPHTLLY